ncbi:hypothetical protein JB92DRAFT_1665743 [Gautieria morchelliformis]|nr:hypothetical protein JB92DRAFT_1665743 [Gautieria morchelliformis]
MEHSAPNPFVPRISIFRLADAIFELRIHLYLPHTIHAPHAVHSALTVADVELTASGEHLVVSGTLTPCVRGIYHARADNIKSEPSQGQGSLLWTDQPCGRFGRNIPVSLSPGAEYVVLGHYVECGDYVVRYTVRSQLGQSQSHHEYHASNATAGVGYHHCDAGINYHTDTSPERLLPSAQTPQILRTPSFVDAVASATQNASRLHTRTTKADALDATLLPATSTGTSGREAGDGSHFTTHNTREHQHTTQTANEHESAQTSKASNPTQNHTQTLTHSADGQGSKQGTKGKGKGSSKETRARPRVRFIGAESLTEDETMQRSHEGVKLSGQQTPQVPARHSKSVKIETRPPTGVAVSQSEQSNVGSTTNVNSARNLVEATAGDSHADILVKESAQHMNQHPRSASEGAYTSHGAPLVSSILPGSGDAGEKESIAQDSQQDRPAEVQAQSLGHTSTYQLSKGLISTQQSGQDKISMHQSYQVQTQTVGQSKAQTKQKSLEFDKSHTFTGGGTRVELSDSQAMDEQKQVKSPMSTGEGPVQELKLKSAEIAGRTVNAYEQRDILVGKTSPSPMPVSPRIPATRVHSQTPQHEQVIVNLAGAAPGGANAMNQPPLSQAPVSDTLTRSPRPGSSVDVPLPTPMLARPPSSPPHQPCDPARGDTSKRVGGNYAIADSAEIDVTSMANVNALDTGNTRIHTRPALKAPDSPLIPLESRPGAGGADGKEHDIRRSERSGHTVKGSGYAIEGLSMQPTTQTSAGLKFANSVGRVSLSKSAGDDQGQASGKALEVTTLPGRVLMQESLTGPIVQASMHGIGREQTARESVLGESVRVSKLDMAESKMQVSAKKAIARISSNETSLVEGRDTHVARGAGKPVGFTVRRGRADTRKPLTSEIMQEFTEETIEPSMQLNAESQKATELGIATSTSDVTVEKFPGTYGRQVSGAIASITGTEGVRGSVTGDMVRESTSTQEIAKSTTQQTTQRTRQTSSDLKISQQTTQQGSQTTDTVLTPGEHVMVYIRGPGRDVLGTRVSDDSSSQCGS